MARVALEDPGLERFKYRDKNYKTVLVDAPGACERCAFGSHFFQQQQSYGNCFGMSNSTDGQNGRPPCNSLARDDHINVYFVEIHAKSST